MKYFVRSARRFHVSIVPCKTFRMCRVTLSKTVTAGEEASLEARTDGKATGMHG
jgi:hypothetical protein